MKIMVVAIVCDIVGVVTIKKKYSDSDDGDL